MTASSLSVREYIADAVVHATGVVAGTVGVVVLIVAVAVEGAAAKFAPVLIYSSGLVAMLSGSAAYNVLESSRRRELLRRLDRSAIFLMIAGTYTPFTTMCLSGTWAIGLTAVVWSIACAGIVMTLMQSRAFDRLSIPVYLALGWAAIIALGPLFASLAPLTLALLGAGGLIYSIGVIFHVWESLPYQKAIWHGFVLAAAAVHYAAVVEGVVIARASC